jgi:N-methylhydantoinase A
MINALKLVTIQRGHDPRDAAFVVSGGAGPALGARLGREMQARFTVIPSYPGIFSAWGMLAARPRADFRTTYFTALSEAALSALADRFGALKAQAIDHFGRGDAAAVSHAMSVDARYRGQEHGVLCPIRADDTVATFTERFHATHAQAYTFRLDDTPVEITGLHLEATLETETITLATLDPIGRSLAASRKGTRAVWFRDGGWTDCPVHARDRLPAGEPLAGPLLIEEATATTLVLPSQMAELSDTGILVLREGV